MPAPNFNRIADAYRWLEYLTLGPFLERTRLHHLPHLHHSRRALVLGDGDGRFLAELLAQNPHLHADAVDLSPAMLRLLRHRTRFAQDRLRTHEIDALTFELPGPYDLVVTHFFLDCLTDRQLDLLLVRVVPHLSPDALWILSDFRIPPGSVRRPIARVLVRLLYLVFRILTGLRTTHLPDHAHALARAGLSRIAEHHLLFGILTSELWQRHPSASLQHPTMVAAPEEIL